MQEFKKISEFKYLIPRQGNMRVDGIIYTSEKLLSHIQKENVASQVKNVATLPGIIKYSLAMPDVHWGYGMPIGGVAAMDFKNGVISPGAVGYDINCLSPETHVLLENGTYLTIKELEKKWREKKVKFVDFSKKNLNDVETLLFLKRYNNPSIYQIETQSGFKIKATKDHPVQTQEGMREVGSLKEGDFILIYPFKGVKYKEPSSKLILSEEGFIKVLENLGKTNKGSAISQILKQIKSRNLLPLTYNHPAIPVILKLMGFIFGDGSISFNKNRGAQIHFFGKRDDLRKIQKDLSKLGFKASIYSRKRNHTFTTSYKTYSFSTIENKLSVNSITLASLFIALGTPYGLKAHRKYRIPNWIFSCPLWQKRLFLASFFGAELSSPKTLNKYNFYAPQLNMSKRRDLAKNAQMFLKDLAKLLREFGVKTYRITQVKGYQYRGKKGITKGFRLQISEEIKNLIKFFETIGYEYNSRKHKESCLACAYLKKKLKVVELRAKVRREIRKLYKKKGEEEKAHGVIKKRGEPRIAFNFPSFEEFKKSCSFSAGLLWDKVEKIKKIPYRNLVYDFTVNDKNHNFIANNFVVSNCGVRVLKTNLTYEDIKEKLSALVSEIFKNIPSGVGSKSKLKLNTNELKKVLERGSQYLVEKGFGTEDDLLHTEEKGRMLTASSEFISHRAMERGAPQLGTLGAGNHFLEIQEIEEIYDEELAQKWGLFKGQITVMIHTGSRGFGYQVCDDYLRVMQRAVQKYAITLPDRQLACAPINSDEGKRYLYSMSAAANYAWANRQVITHWIRESFENVFKKKWEEFDLSVLWDVAHNIGKIEEFEGKKIFIHRKGATRAFPAGKKELPSLYQQTGQPVIVPGSMGTASYILVAGEKAYETFYSTCHGAGREMSRHQALKQVNARDLIRELKSKNILLLSGTMKTVAEEAPQAYKNVDEVVEICQGAGISRKVAKMKPLGVVKG
ncbi:MAG: intein-containing RctB family protein [Elusimicrobia bacterium]|nr:intein-containing RctB family protein [Elusimicrobiota bacterium]